MGYATDVVNYLDRKGAIEVLIAVASMDGVRYTDIEPNVSISSTTLSRRLSEGVECSVLELNQRPVEYGTEKLYRHTRLGRFLYRNMDEQNIVETQHRLRELKERQEQQIADFLEWADQQPDVLKTESDSDDWRR